MSTLTQSALESYLWGAAAERYYEEHADDWG